ncbi:MAG: HAD-IA family hydrolase [candidate division Zixibacteria bacterium]|nr:HAD-IA family hydrolase [candidate division Zixibacteria bacterium]
MFPANICTIIFDLDGTLIDSADGIVESANYAFTAMGFPPRKREEITPYIGYPLEDVFRAFGDGDYTEYLRLFRECGDRAVVEASRALPGADCVIRTLFTRGVTLAVGTTKSRTMTGKIIERLGWTSFISAFLGADDVIKVKPHPEQFLKLLEMLRADPSRTLVVGDTANDVLAAHGAGIRIAAVPSPYGRNGEMEQSGPDYKLTGLEELPDLVGNIRHGN